MTDFIRQQLSLHPSIMPQDIIKMCFQAAYGAEHLLTDINKAKGYFMSEYESCQPNDEPVIEFIAPDVCRVNIAPWKKFSLPPEWLFQLFVQSASMRFDNSEKQFFEFIYQWSEYARENQGQALAFSFDEFDDALQKYLATCKNDKPRAIHHSQHYRDNEKPAYRVISGPHVRLVPILTALAGMGGGVIAIDGRAASGKSTLAAGLKSVIGAEIVHMDDFFLPAHLRTQERLNEPGGNVHYERLAEEVLPNLHDKVNAFEYRVFNCGTMSYNGTRKIMPRKWLVVEGSYSHHPKLGDYMDVRVFSTIDATTQISRITARNGEKLTEMFATKWIPMEEKYFDGYKIAENAQLRV
ncbi:MAG: hypothetical protein FWC32_14380 [Firmicutes bacterium]|nr:hypothetical protein [Bacillota bacterium]